MVGAKNRYDHNNDGRGLVEIVFNRRQTMIPKSGFRFSKKIMLKKTS
jgi:hypothetical protein